MGWGELWGLQTNRQWGWYSRRHWVVCQESCSRDPHEVGPHRRGAPPQPCPGDEGTDRITTAWWACVKPCVHTGTDFLTAPWTGHLLSPLYR